MGNVKEIAVIIHGGAGRPGIAVPHQKIPVMREALDAAWRAACGGKPAVYAVAEALRVLEGSEYFNAGFGGYPNRNGIVLLDVGLMEGSGNFVSLVHMRRIKYPSSVALDLLGQLRTILTTWTYELERIVEESCDLFKERYGLVATHEGMIAPYVRKLIETEQLRGASGEPSGTVGCVVRDLSGQLAAGTSTGGVGFKFNGRIGDSPIVGSGVFADNEICALSTSGHGESMLSCGFSGFVISALREALRLNINVFRDNPEHLQNILKTELSELERKTSGRAGMIIIPPVGNPGFAFNAPTFTIAHRSGTPDKIYSELVSIERRE